MVILYDISVDRNGVAKVARRPATDFGTTKFKKDRDLAAFISNSPLTFIQYVSQASDPTVDPTADSPFASNGPLGGQPVVNKPFEIGDALKGPFFTHKVGKHHFQCGRMVGAAFVKWAVTPGDDTPTEP